MLGKSRAGRKEILVILYCKASEFMVKSRLARMPAEETDGFPDLHGSCGAPEMTVMSDKERAEALERGMVNLVALLEHLEPGTRINYYELHRPLVNASPGELEIAVTMLGDAEVGDVKEAERYIKLSGYYHARWLHLQQGGSVGATTKEEIAAEMDKFDSWLQESDPDYQLVHQELDATIQRISLQMDISPEAAIRAYNSGEAW